MLKCSARVMRPMLWRAAPEYYEFLREKFCPPQAKMKIRGQYADKNRNEKSLFI